MGGRKSKSDPLRLDVNRVSREEQYGWFKTICDASDDHIISLIKTNPQIVTTVMHFDFLTKKDIPCDCPSILEKYACTKGESIKRRLIQRLGLSVKKGFCPHIILQKEGLVVRVLEASDDVLDVAMETTRINEIDKVLDYNLCFDCCGFYWIHVAVVLRRTQLVKRVIHQLKDVIYPSFVFCTIPKSFSAFYFSLLSEDIDLSTFLIKLDQSFAKRPPVMKHVFFAEHLASFGNENIINIFFKMTGARTKENIHNAYKGAFSVKSLPVLNKLQELKAVPNKELLMTELQKAINSKDIAIATFILQYPQIVVTPYMLYTAVSSGDIELVRRLLSHRQTLFQAATYSESLTDAVLTNSYDILKVLIDKGFDVNTCKGSISCLKWAEILQFDESKELLLKAGAKSFYKDDKTCIFNSALNLKTTQIKLVLERLIENGYDVNDETDGTPCLFTCIEKGKEFYRWLYILLINGADPYRKPETFKYFLIRTHKSDYPELMRVFLRANVNVSYNCRLSPLQHLIQLMRDSPYDGEFYAVLRHTLRNSHSITEPDRENLVALSKSEVPQTCKDDINEYLMKIKSLQKFCRDSIRRHYGQSFHKFVDTECKHYPERITEFLNCKEVRDGNSVKGF